MLKFLHQILAMLSLLARLLRFLRYLCSTYIQELIENKTRAASQASAAGERATGKYQTEANGRDREKSSVRGRDGDEERTLGSHLEGQRKHYTKGKSSNISPWATPSVY